MISKLILKPRPFNSQKIRRRWVMAYIISFALVVLSIALDRSSYIKPEELNNISWVTWSMAMLSILVAIVSFLRLLGSDYAILARTPIQRLDERQVLVHYRATELCFHTLSLIFIFLALYVLFIPKMGLPFLNHNALRQVFSMTVFFLTGLKVAMIAWLEPDPIEETPAEVAGV